MHIVFAASECVPFAKTTWCATVAGNPGNSVTMPNNLASNHYNEPPISTTSLACSQTASR